MYTVYSVFNHSVVQAHASTGLTGMKTFHMSQDSDSQPSPQVTLSCMFLFQLYSCPPDLIKVLMLTGWAAETDLPEQGMHESVWPLTGPGVQQ